MPEAFKQFVDDFKSSFAFDRFKSQQEPRQLELSIPGHPNLILDGQSKICLGNKGNQYVDTQQIIINIPGAKELFIEIDLRFDLEPSFEDDESICSPVGLQIKVFTPLSYEDSMIGVFYKLKPEDEVIL